MGIRNKGIYCTKYEVRDTKYGTYCTKYQVRSTHRSGQATYEVPGRKYSRNTVEINRASSVKDGIQVLLLPISLSLPAAAGNVEC